MGEYGLSSPKIEKRNLDKKMTHPKHHLYSFIFQSFKKIAGSFRSISFVIMKLTRSWHNTMLFDSTDSYSKASVPTSKKTT